MKMTTFGEFAALAKQGTFLPVCKELMADLLTPVSAFLKIAEYSDYAFLLESVEGGERIARYSFLGKDPLLVIRAAGQRTVVERSGTSTTVDEPLVPVLRRVMAEYRAPSVPGLPRFTGGAVGFLGYEASRWFEPTRRIRPADGLPLNRGADAPPDGAPAAAGSEIPAVFMVFDTLLAFDHVQHRILVIANAQVTPGSDLEALYGFACARIGFLESELRRELSNPTPPDAAHVSIRASMARERFETNVRIAKEYIAAGDIFQVVLSQRFDVETPADPFRVYRALRHINPSPYMFFVRAGETSIAGGSPEMLVRVEGGRVETHPIAGTRRRGATELEDAELARDLERDPKERAEHVMLVDLGRNDVGRVCEYGSVRVPQFMSVERYSHVMHLVSVVEGRLAEGRDRLDALVSCFPAGTVSGAPKVRAMQIIDELEADSRGIYAGAVGYVDFAGNLDFCIAIRTVVMEGGRASCQAGAGIVADSDPAAEYEESCAKARVLLQALEMAASGGW
ncbi:MAG: anthranilate synthase component I [Vicinamibacterales bacterium]